MNDLNVTLQTMIVLVDWVMLRQVIGNVFEKMHISIVNTVEKMGLLSNSHHNLKG